MLVSIWSIHMYSFNDTSSTWPNTTILTSCSCQYSINGWYNFLFLWFSPKNINMRFKAIQRKSLQYMNIIWILFWLIMLSLCSYICSISKFTFCQIPLPLPQFQGECVQVFQVGRKWESLLSAQRYKYKWGQAYP